jgi:hypothetical protein
MLWGADLIRRVILIVGRHCEEKEQEGTPVKGKKALRSGIGGLARHPLSAAILNNQIIDSIAVGG